MLLLPHVWPCCLLVQVGPALDLAGYMAPRQAAPRTKAIEFCVCVLEAPSVAHWRWHSQREQPCAPARLHRCTKHSQCMSEGKITRAQPRSNCQRNAVTIFSSAAQQTPERKHVW